MFAGGFNEKRMTRLPRREFEAELANLLVAVGRSPFTDDAREFELFCSTGHERFIRITGFAAETVVEVRDRKPPAVLGREAVQ